MDTINLEDDQLAEHLASFTASLEKTMFRFREASAFISCLSAQDVTDENANALVAERGSISALFSGAMTDFSQKLADIPEEKWETVMTHDKLRELEFVLTEYRTNAKDLLSNEEESLINDLAVDGYHAWNQMYDTIVGNIALLQDTGRMSVEELAVKHLDVDLTKKDFWETAIGLCVRDVGEFLTL